MAFQVNTNINAMNAHVMGVFTQTGIKNSLEKLSSGLRINKAADDASGMLIADSLSSQANALGQAIRNTNDGCRSKQKSSTPSKLKLSKRRKMDNLSNRVKRFNQTLDA